MAALTRTVSKGWPVTLSTNLSGPFVCSSKTSSMWGELCGGEERARLKIAVRRHVPILFEDRLQAVDMLLDEAVLFQLWLKPLQDGLAEREQIDCNFPGQSS